MNNYNILQEPLPLYDTLYEMFQHHTTFDEIDSLMQYLRKLDLAGMQIVSLIIYKHSQSSAVHNVPYQGQTVNTQDVKFDVRQFDPVLHHILLEFAKRHLAKQNTYLTPIE
jgi:hypothetical protein